MNRRRVLVLCDDAWHPADVVRRGLKPLADLEFEFEFLADAAQWSPRMMKHFSVVVVAKSNHRCATDQSAWLTAKLQIAFRQFVQHGGGMLVIHSGTAGYGELVVMRETTGGVFMRHPDQCPVTVEPRLNHTLTRGVNAFTERDEHYFMVLDDLRADIFLHSRSAHGRQPAGWTRREGQGRVCVLTPGHNVEVWLHPEYQKLLRNGLKWVAKLS